MQLEKAEKKRKEQERQRSISRRIVHNASTNQLEKIVNAKKNNPFPGYLSIWNKFSQLLKEQQRTNKLSQLLDKSCK
jgi:hypothetical protein